MSTISASEPIPRNILDGECTARTAASRTEANVDATLVKRFNGGDESAFNEIVRRHRARIFNVVSGCLANHADVEEVVDDTFLRTYRGLATFRGDSSLATWLHHIAINLSRNRYWFQYRRRHLAPSLDEPIAADSNATLADFVPSECPDPAQELDREEFAAVVAACVERLPARQREIVTLRVLRDGSYAQVATALGITLGTVKSRLARARNHLRAEVNAIAPEAALRSARSF